MSINTMNKVVIGTLVLCGLEIGYGGAHNNTGWLVIGILGAVLLTGALGFSAYRSKIQSHYLDP